MSKRARRLRGWSGIWAAALVLPGFWSGVGLAALGFSAPAWLFPLAAGGGVALGLLVWGRAPALVIGVWITLGLAAGTSAAPRGAARDPHAPPDDERVWVLLRVERVIDPWASARWSGTIHAWARPAGWRRLTRPEPVEGWGDLPAGRSFLVVGRLRSPHPDRGPGPRRLTALAAYDASGGAFTHGFWRRLRDARSRLASRCTEVLGRDVSILSNWATLNVQPEELDPAWVEPFRRTGTIHLLSISGLHLVLVGGIFWMAARIVSRGARWSSIPAALALSAYTIFVGAPAPAVRATLAALLAALGPARGRGARGWNALGWGAALLPLVDPAELLRPSLILSLAAMAGVMLGADIGKTLDARGLRMAGAARAAGSLLLVSITAVLLTAPWSLRYFGSFYPLGVLANLVAVPVMGLAFPSLCAAVVVIACGGGAGHPIVRVGAAGAEVVLATVRGAAALTGHGPWIGALSTAGALALCFTIGACLFVLARAASRRRRPPLPVVLAVCLPGLMVPILERRPTSASGLHVAFLSVGQGDAIWIRASGHDSLFDLGPGGSRDPLVPALLARGTRRLERVFVSHGDLDHWGGLEGLLRSPIRVDSLIVPMEGEFPDRFWQVLATAGQRPQVVRAGRGFMRRLAPGIEAALLQPLPHVKATSDNNGSLVLWLRTGTWDVVLQGDLEREGEAMLLRTPLPERTDILQAGHHGSRTASSPPWVDRLRPLVMFASLGVANRFGFPHRETLETCEARAVPLVRTDQEGDIEITLRGRSVAIRRARPSLSAPGGCAISPR